MKKPPWNWNYLSRSLYSQEQKIEHHIDHLSSIYTSHLTKQRLLIHPDVIASLVDLPRYMDIKWNQHVCSEAVWFRSHLASKENVTSTDLAWKKTLHSIHPSFFPPGLGKRVWCFPRTSRWAGCRREMPKNVGFFVGKYIVCWMYREILSLVVTRRSFLQFYCHVVGIVGTLHNCIW